MLSFICLQCGRPGFHPWVGKIPWRRAWQPTPVFLPGESSWTEEPGGRQALLYFSSQRSPSDWLYLLPRGCKRHEDSVWGCLAFCCIRGLSPGCAHSWSTSLRVCCALDAGSQTQQRTTGKWGEQHQRLWVQDAVRSLPSCGTSEEYWSPEVQLIPETGAPPTQHHPVSSSKDPVTPTVLFFSGKRLARLPDGLCSQSFHNRCQLTKSRLDGALSDPELGFAAVFSLCFREFIYQPFTYSAAIVRLSRRITDAPLTDRTDTRGLRNREMG